MADDAPGPAFFRPIAITEDTTKLTDALVNLMTGLPEWWNVGAEATREARPQGRGRFPAATKSPRRAHDRHSGSRQQRDPAATDRACSSARGSSDIHGGR